MRLPYADRMWRCLTVIAVVGLALTGVSASQEQSPPPTGVATEPYFSGTVTKLEKDSITVARTVLGKQDAVRTFIVTSETRTEGKLRVNARVTVQFVESQDGDRAVQIVVRPAGAGKK